MAVSLKKPEKVSLEKPELPPKVREFTPVHLIDEDETIQRPRRPPNHTKVREFTPIHLIDEEETIQRPLRPPNQPQQSDKSKQHCKDDGIKSSPLATNNSKTSIIVHFLVLIFTLLFGLGAFLVLYNYSPSSSSDPSIVDFFDIIGSVFSTIMNNPFCIALLGLTFVRVFISLLKRIFGGY